MTPDARLALWPQSIERPHKWSQSIERPHKWFKICF